MLWIELLEEVARHLPILELRMRAADASGCSYPCRHAPGEKQAATHEVLVGLGEPTAGAELAQVDPHPKPGIVLNDKGAILEGMGAIGCVSGFVRAVGSSWVDVWAASFRDDGTISDFLQTFTIVAEDASPDSCLGLLLFLGAANGVAPSDLPVNWIDYARRWESGDVRSTGNVMVSWGALHSALTHARFSGANATNEHRDQRLLDEELSGAWIDGLGLVVSALLAGAAPEDLSSLEGLPLVQRAAGALRYERQHYLFSLAHGDRLQLLLPLARNRKRFRLVDAFLDVEQSPFGIMKQFLRTDTEHPWLRDGFGVLALHRPSARGSGNDMVVSVDPGLGVDLRDLWIELEKREDDAWEGRRPCDRPRIPIAAYPEGKRQNGLPSPNEPWWDDRGSYTLVAAPKKIRVDGVTQDGSRLSWGDVAEALWSVYNPLRDLLVTDRFAARDRCLYECVARETAGDDSRTLRIARWKVSHEFAAGILDSPTVERYLAVCTTRGQQEVCAVSLDELLRAVEYDRCELFGGFAIVTARGAFIVDDWRSPEIEVAEVVQEFERARQRDTASDEVMRKVGQLRERIRTALRERGRMRNGEEVPTLSELMKLKLDISLELAETAPQTRDPHIQEFREKLEARWGVAKKLDEFRETVEQIEQSLRDLSELRTNQLIARLTIYGFPLVLFGSFFEFLFAEMPDAQVRFGGIHWLGVATYLTLCGVTVAVLKIATRR